MNTRWPIGSDTARYFKNTPGPAGVTQSMLSLLITQLLDALPHHAPGSPHAQGARPRVAARALDDSDDSDDSAAGITVVQGFQIGANPRIPARVV